MRIIHTDGNPTTQRNRLRRTLAEALHRLGDAPAPTDTNRDLVALLVYILRQLQAGVEQSAAAWDKRDYYMKAERFRQEWAWCGPMERLLTHALRYGPWDEVAELLPTLRQQVAEIQVTKLTRDETLWAGAAARLLAERD